ncbi:GntR family transcriptional regulator [Roseibium sp. FZY0029]|uniref:GntR family transcriptional regulator n=1 Tax=Roseibium sp. FZY0029 TaxID=3116647 RepID=UPI002EC00852|nr:GntR family transcriptional regulator [Roseibium sp. FZY0029]
MSTLPEQKPSGRVAALPELARVQRESLQERVYQEVSRNLMHGVFEAGQVLRMQSLADQLAVSVMPVREALARLVSENALEVMQSRSVRVPLISEEAIEDLKSARCLIEGELVRIAAQRLTQESLNELKQLTEECEAAFAALDESCAAETSLLNYRFHFGIYEAAGSKVLLPVVKSLWLQSGPYVRTAATIYGKNPNLTAIHHHWALIEALEARDADRAVAALHEDITQSFNLIRNQILEGGLEA